MTDALTVNSSTSHSIIETTPTFTFSVDDTATNVVLNFGPMEDGKLLGSHTLTLTITMLNFSFMDYFTEETRTINLTIESVCE